MGNKAEREEMWNRRKQTTESIASEKSGGEEKELHAESSPVGGAPFWRRKRKPWEPKAGTMSHS